MEPAPVRGSFRGCRFVLARMERLASVPYEAIAEDGTKSTRKVQVPLMSHINLTIPRGKLTIVMGPTGGGKSTLLLSLIGETDLTEEIVLLVNGSLAFMSQEAWIMSTVRNNILIGLPFDHGKYLHVVHACLTWISCLAAT